MRTVFPAIVLAVACVLPCISHGSALAAARASIPKPSKTDICKSMGKLGGDLDYVSFKAYWNCQEVITVKKGVPYTENFACTIDTTKSWGYWTTDRRVTVKVLAYNKPPGQISILFLLKVGTKARVRLWAPCKY